MNKLVLALAVCAGPLSLSTAAQTAERAQGLPTDITDRSVALEGGAARGKLQVEVDKSKVDLEAGRLEVRMNRPASQVRLKVIGESGDVIAEETYRFENAPAGKPLVIRWKATGEKIAKLEVYGYDTDENWKGVALTPWQLNIPHKEVLFETDKAVIRKSEAPKLEDSFEKITDALRRYRELGNITLYIAGHTDSVGSDEYNQSLSQRRAQSIAAWFLKRGLKVPVAYEGFGETALRVKTKDEVDEPRNRRVDYILAVEPPMTKGGKTPAWKAVSRGR